MTYLNNAELLTEKLNIKFIPKCLGVAMTRQIPEL